MAAGDFTIPDDTGTGTELTTLFGVAQGVGEAPVLLTAPTTQTVPGAFGPGVGPGGPGTRGPSTTETTPGKKLTLVQTLQQFYGMDKATLQSVQRQLYAGGFFSSAYYSANPKTPQYGAADDDSFAAFKSAAVQAARSGKTLPDVIDTAIQAVAAGGGPGAKGPAKPQPVLQPPSATDVFAQIEESQKKKFGHGVVSRGQIESIIGDYQQLVTDRQRRVQQAQIDNTAATVTQAPDVQSYVESRLGQAAPKEVALNDSLHAADLVMQLFGGGGNG